MLLLRAPRDAIVGLGDVLVLVVLLVLIIVEVERLKIERRLDAPIGVGLSLLDHRLALILQLWRLFGLSVSLSPPKASLDLGAGMHGDMHGGTERGIGPFARKLGTRRPQ